MRSHRTPEQVAEGIAQLQEASKLRQSLARTNWRELYAAGLMSDKEAEIRAVDELHAVDIFAQARVS